MAKHLDEDLIANDYKFAKDKNAQIKILAELNACSESDIINILAKKNLIPGLPKKEKLKRAKPVIWTPELDREVQTLHREGLTIVEIAERLGINKQSIYDRRAYFNKIAKNQNSKPESKDKPLKRIKTVDDEQKERNTKMDKIEALETAKKMLEYNGFNVNLCHIDIIGKTFRISGDTQKDKDLKEE